MASENTCPHGLPYYGNGTSDWGDCAVCFPRTAYWRAWQAFRDFLNGTPEQWAEVLEFAQSVLDLANEMDYSTVASRAIRAYARGVPGLEWNVRRSDD